MVERRVKMGGFAGKDKMVSGRLRTHEILLL